MQTFYDLPVSISQEGIINHIVYLPSDVFGSSSYMASFKSILPVKYLEYSPTERLTLDGPLVSVSINVI